MAQSKRQSLLETCCNTVVGFIGSFLITVLCLSHSALSAGSTAFTITAACTAWSLIRGYWLRRLFNHLSSRTQ